MGYGMSVPLQFPDPREEVRRRSLEFQRLTPEDRWHEIVGLMAFGWAMIRSSPEREAIEKRMDEQEREWQRIQQRLFALYGG
jgi:hypothetical protein